MSTHDVERELTALLHRHAEDAMTDTDTPSELDEFHRSVEGRAHPDRRRRVAVGVTAAVAAAAVVAVAVWAADPDADRSQPAPANPGADNTDDVAVAQGFVDAYADHDIEGVSAYLAHGAEPWPDWEANVRRDAAWNVGYLVDECSVLSSYTNGASITCPYDVHVLSSEEVGLGPFPDNHFEVVVRDGEVTSADSTIPFESNGVGNHVQEVTRWVRNHHPADTDFLFKEEQDVTEQQWPRWTRLWHEYLEEYVESSS